MKKSNTTPPVIQSAAEESLKSQMADLDDKFKRLLADYQNQDKRHTAQKSAIYKLANETLLDKIIPVLDDLERAQGHLNDSGFPRSGVPDDGNELARAHRKTHTVECDGVLRIDF